MTDAAVVTRDLTKHYGSKIGCEKVCLTVSRGHIFGLLGRNGAGKSTLVKTLVGLIHPTSGEAELLGMPLADFGVRARIGFMPETFRYQEWMTPLEMLAFHARLKGMDRRVVQRESERVLHGVGLSRESRWRIRAFSKGMQQRLGIACAMLGAPDLLFLDEPTSALDPHGRRVVRELLVAERERGATVFLNSHLLSEVEMVCDHVAFIDSGRVLESGPLAELLDGPCEVEVTLAEPLAAPLRLPQGIGLLSGRGCEIVFGLPGEASVPELVASLVAEGARIASVGRRRRSLESLFMETIGEDADE